MEAAIQAGKILEKVASAVPVAGTPLAAIIGSVNVILDGVKSAKDERAEYYRLALRAVDLATTIEAATRDKWDHLEDNIKERLDTIVYHVDEIGKFYQEYSRKRHSARPFKSSKYSQKLLDFKSCLDHQMVLFNLAVGTSTSTGRNSLVKVSVDRRADVELAEGSRSVERYQNDSQRQLDEDGLVIFSRQDLIGGGNSKIETILSYSACSWPTYPPLNVAITYHNTPAVVSMRVVKTRQKLYAVRTWLHDDAGIARKMFRYENMMRLRTENIPGLPKLVGTIGRNGSSPCAVFELDAQKKYAKFADLLRAYNPLWSDNIAILALVQLTSAELQLNSFNNFAGCTTVSDGALGFLESWVVETQQADGEISFGLVYTGELAGWKDVEHLDVMSDREIWNACRMLLWRERGMRTITYSLEAQAMDPIFFDGIDPRAGFSVIVPVLLQRNPRVCRSIQSYQISGCHLSMGDFGYQTIHGGFKCLGNLSHLFVSSDFDCIVHDSGIVSHAEEICSSDGIKIASFRVPPHKNKLELLWRVCYFGDSDICLSNFNSLSAGVEFTQHFNLVRGIAGYVIVYYNVTDISFVDSVEPQQNIFLHVSTNSSAAPTFLRLYLSSSATPDLERFSNSDVTFTEISGGQKVEWAVNPCTLWHNSAYNSLYVPSSFLGLQTVVTLENLMFAHPAPSDSAMEFWRSFMRHCELWISYLDEDPINCIKIKSFLTDDERICISFTFEPNDYFEDEVITLDIPSDYEMPKPLLANPMQWKKVFDPELGLDKNDILHDKWGSSVRFEDTTFLQFLSACHDLHNNAMVDGVSNILILHVWQNEIGRPLRWFAKGVRNIQAALEACDYAYDQVDPRSLEWWEFSGTDSSDDGDAEEDNVEELAEEHEGDDQFHDIADEENSATIKPKDDSESDDDSVYYDWSD